MFGLELPELAGQFFRKPIDEILLKRQHREDALRAFRPQGPRRTDWRNEAIPAACQRFDEARVVRGIAQRVAKFAEGGIQAAIEIDKGVRRPQLIAENLARDQLAGTV
jgi:hypothetical protein